MNQHKNGLLSNCFASALMKLVCLAWISLGWDSSTLAGIGSENIILVVNAKSSFSRRIANEYAFLREIHPKNIILLDDVPGGESCKIEDFQAKILQPILQEIAKRKLDNQIDCIVYSTGFPTQSSFKSWTTQLEPPPAKHQTPTASTTSLTYFYRYTVSNSPNIINLEANHYARRPANVVLDFPVSSPEEIEKFNAAKGLFTDEKWVEAATAFGELLKEQPFQCGLAYWQCRCFARAGDKTAATDAMMDAIRRGWSFKIFAQSDANLVSLKSFTPFSAALKSIKEPFWEFSPPIPFSAKVSWALSGLPEKADRSPDAYLLSCMLGASFNDSPKGNTEQEILDYLKRSVNADNRRPKGEFAFTSTKDVRCQTRQPNFASAVEALNELGFKSSITTNPLPEVGTNVIGATIGAASFDWAKSGGKLQPGAICDNLTSFGARFHATNGQTTVADSLRNGAAGASGTVVEPYAIQNKFPFPLIHAYYAKGFSMVESFYLSVNGPYQLLIVGDALCQPFAKPPMMEVDDSKSKGPVKGKVPVVVRLKEKSPSAKRIDFYFDGIRISPIRGEGVINIDTTPHADGYHEMRLVAIANDGTDATSRLIVPLEFNNRGHRTELAAKVEGKIIRVAFKAEGADSIKLYCQSELLKETQKSESTFSIATDLVGRGPVQLEAIALFGKEAVRSIPVTVIVVEESDAAKKTAKNSPATSPPAAGAK